MRKYQIARDLGRAEQYVDELTKENRELRSNAHVAAEEPVAHAENVRRSALVGRWQRGSRCKQGHEFTPENTYERRDRPGTRECRTCRSDASRRHYERQGAAA